MSERILIIGYGFEKTIQHTLAHFRKVGLRYSLFDLNDFTEEKRVSYIYNRNELIVKMEDMELNFADCRSVYYRGYIREKPDNSNLQGLEKFIKHLRAWLYSAQRLVINPPLSGLCNYSKYYHLELLNNKGFNTPDTWILGNPELARRIFESDWNWISKGCSSYRTQAQKMDPYLFTSLELLKNCPSLFQRFIDGQNVRVHVVGLIVLAVKIHSTAMDYRFSTDPNSFSKIDVPEEIAKLCIEYCKEQNLYFVGFDFIINSDGQWYVLEANPMPGYEYFDIDGAIAAALTNLLVEYRIEDGHPKGKAFISDDRIINMSKQFN